MEKTTTCLAQIIPIVLFYMYFAYPDKMLALSIEPMGRFIAVCLILFYTSLDILYGIVFVIFVIFYYQMDLVEGFNGDFTGVTSYEPMQVSQIQIQMPAPLIASTRDPVVVSVYSHQEPVGLMDHKLAVQQDIVYPKLSDEWTDNVWNTWFSDNSTRPFASTGVVSQPFALI
jgi:hypothetical protein